MGEAHEASPSNLGLILEVSQFNVYLQVSKSNNAGKYFNFFFVLGWGNILYKTESVNVY